jgi:predicted AlkP superfamily phosphohydrolase/phosphomutase
MRLKIMTKVLVIGLDGATWRIIKPLINKGKLPTFKKLIKEGVCGELESTIPPWTIPAWNSFATGKNPGKLGIFTFMCRAYGSYKFKPYFFLKKRQQCIWDILSKEGKNITLINVPNIHSAYQINGYMIAGWLYKSEDTLMWPLDLKEKIDMISGGYEASMIKVDIHKGEIINLPLTNRKYLEGVFRVMNKRFKVLEFFLKEEWDFLFVVFTTPDRVQHRFWQNKKVLLDCYMRIDNMLKKLIQLIDKDTVLFLVSDHGFGPQNKVFNINEWLLKEGYLKLKDKERHKLVRIGNFLRKTRLSLFIKPLVNLLPTKFSKKLLKSSRSLSIEKANVDWSQTKVFAYSPCGDIYINLKGRDLKGTVSLKDYDNLRNEIINKLKKLTDPKTGQKISVQVYKKEEIYKGEKRDMAPDLIIKIDENINGINPIIGSGKTFSEKRQRGEHRIEGIFLAFGPNIKKGVHVEDVRIYDIAPTILHVFNLPIPIDMDGRVLTEIFEERSEFRKREIKFVEREKVRIAERIKQMRSSGRI